jgi:hypothetical protein
MEEAIEYGVSNRDVFEEQIREMQLLYFMTEWK